MKISTLLSALLMAGTAFSAQDPLADLPEDLKAAHVTFVELCAPCHGVLGDGSHISAANVSSANVGDLEPA